MEIPVAVFPKPTWGACMGGGGVAAILTLLIWGGLPRVTSLSRYLSRSFPKKIEQQTKMRNYFNDLHQGVLNQKETH